MGITKVKDGVWKVDDRDIRGRRYRKSFPTRAEAKEFVSQIKYGNYHPRLENKSVKDAIRHYFENVSMGKTEGTWRNEKLYFNELYDFICDLGIKTVCEIYPADIESFQNSLKAKTQATTVNRKFNCYKHFFTKCVDWGWIQQSPCRTIKRLMEKPKKRNVWSDEQIEMVLQSMPTWAKPITFFLAMTGCRPIQARTLKWKQIDFEKNLLTVDSIKGSRYQTRTIHLCESLKCFLKELRKRYSKSGQLVFPNSEGREITKDLLSKVVRQARKSAGLPDFVAYDLRHTYTTILAEQGMNAETMRRIIGHSDIRMTQEYIHVSSEHLKSKAEEASQTRSLVNPVLGNFGHLKGK